MQVFTTFFTTVQLVTYGHSPCILFIVSQNNNLPNGVLVISQALSETFRAASTGRVWIYMLSIFSLGRDSLKTFAILQFQIVTQESDTRALVFRFSPLLVLTACRCILTLDSQVGIINGYAAIG
jgi:hypothetical protein